VTSVRELFASTHRLAARRLTAGGSPPLTTAARSPPDGGVPARTVNHRREFRRVTLRADHGLALAVSCLLQAARRDPSRPCAGRQSRGRAPIEAPPQVASTSRPPSP
jgi:hypothetical protein